MNERVCQESNITSEIETTAIIHSGTICSAFTLLMFDSVSVCMC